MKKLINSLLLFTAVLIICGCEKLLLAPDPENTQLQNFIIFWEDFNRYYAQFQIKNINWDSVKTVNISQITSNTSTAQLFKIMSDMVAGINDMHVNLYTPIGNASRKSIIPSSYPSNRLINAGNYIRLGASQNSAIEYRECQNSDLGYLIIPSFSGDGDEFTFIDQRYCIIDEIVSKFRDKKGLIIDLRWNSGGNTFNAETVAGRFADKQRTYAMYREKTGTGKTDFSDWKSCKIGPKGGFQFLKPVVILTSRTTASSAEMFVLAMRSLPNVTIVGDTTGGGVGSPVYRELPNGWTFRLSARYYADTQMRVIEGNGIIPDITVRTTTADSAHGIDRILEKGIEILAKM